MSFLYKFKSDCPEKTREIAGEIIRVSGAKRILLHGELGAGKTEFVRGLGESLGVEGSISSPTFVLEHQYECDGRLGFKTICHWDCYRLSKASEDIELYEQLDSDEILTVVEWAEKILLPEILQLARIYIRIPQNSAENEVSQQRELELDVGWRIDGFAENLES